MTQRSARIPSINREDDQGALRVCATSTPVIDPFLFDLWCRGASLSEAQRQRADSAAIRTTTMLYEPVSLLEAPESTDIAISRQALNNDTEDQFRTFDSMTYFLKNPCHFQFQTVFQCGKLLQRHLIERYYSFDPAFVRELIGKKLSGRARKDLDDIADNLGVPLYSCQRQFDNMRRILKAVVDVSNVVEEMENTFLLSRSQSLEYFAVLFLCHHRVEPSRKRHSSLSYVDVLNMAQAMLHYWSMGGSESGTLDLDKKFKDDVRDIKALLLSEKKILDEVKTLAGANKHVAPLVPEKKGRLKLTSIVRDLLSIGANLGAAGEFRDFFIDLQEKVIDPIHKAELSRDEVEYENLSSIPQPARERYSAPWLRFIEGISACVSRMY